MPDFCLDPKCEDCNSVQESLLHESAEKVAKTFSAFLKLYRTFKDMHGLSGKSSHPYEPIVGIVDKAGRCSRYIKHNVRNDPKPNWEVNMQGEMAGVLAYLVMMITDVDFTNIEDGMIEELKKAVRQHAKKHK